MMTVPFSPDSLPGGEYCEIIVTMTPTTTGPLSDELIVTSDAPGSPPHADLTGGVCLRRLSSTYLLTSWSLRISWWIHPPVTRRAYADKYWTAPLEILSVTVPANSSSTISARFRR